MAPTRDWEVLVDTPVLHAEAAHPFPVVAHLASSCYNVQRSLTKHYCEDPDGSPPTIRPVLNFENAI